MMNPSRRDMLKVSLQGLAMVSIGGSVPAFLPRMAYADTVTGGKVSNDNILVVVQLSGGNDGLNTIVPVGNDLYMKARPKIALKNGLHKLDDNYALNAGMGAFKRLFDDGRLSILHGCGYPNANRSHFESMAIWHAADPAGGDGSGWLGHYLDHLSRGTQKEHAHAAGTENPLKAVNIGSQVPMALIRSGGPVASISNFSEFDVRFDDRTKHDMELERAIMLQLNAQSPDDPVAEFLTREANNAVVNAASVRTAAEKYKPTAPYPAGLGQRLEMVARLIAGEHGTKVFYVEVGGFDTHANQLQGHEQLLRNVSDGIEVFLDDMKAKGYADKVTVMCFSEFGRRVKQNDSDGTDHGAAGPMFLAGAKIKPGLHGQHPSLEDDKLDAGDLRFTTDFRNVYATLLKDWLNGDPKGVLKGDWSTLPLLG